MAASIYATPPPDLSSEDTALSDVSNNSTSSLNQRNSRKDNDSSIPLTNANSNSNRSSCNTSTISITTDTKTTTTVTTTVTTATTATVATDEVTASIATTASTKTRTTAASSSSSAIPSTSIKKQKRSIADVLMENTSQQEAQQHQDENYMSTTELENSVYNIPERATITAATNAAAMAAVAAAANAAAMQLQLLEAINDAAKKRRKQNNPSRLAGGSGGGDDTPDGCEPESVATATSDTNNASLLGRRSVEVNSSITSKSISTTIPVDYEDKLSKMFLPKSMEQLKETFELLQQQQKQQKEFGDISATTTAVAATTAAKTSSAHQNDTSVGYSLQVPKREIIEDDDENVEVNCLQQRQMTNNDRNDDSDHDDDGVLKNPYLTYCRECGENFETDFKLSLHMLQEHNTSGNETEGVTTINSDGGMRQKDDLSAFDILSSVKMKLERPDYESSKSPSQTNIMNRSTDETALILPNGKEPWMNAMTPMAGFPFAPDAATAAALSANGYLPLLGVSGFPSVDGLNRPPLRIFNPEAYCDLCNKEFCNKYFLKTHKANKHGIYDPAITGSSTGVDSSANSNPALSTMNQMFQLQMHQQQLQQKQQQQQLELQHQQQQQPPPPQQQNIIEAQTKPQSSQAQTSSTPNTLQQQQLNPPAPPQIFCDICSKRFTNVFAMRRHRAKSHEQSQQTQRNSPNDQTQFNKNDSINDNKSESPNTTNSSTTAGEISTKQFQMPEGFRQDFSLEQEEVTFTPQPRKLSPQSQQQAREANFAHDKLKRLGVLNPEAFCELCCKEYCNKYFLRTHKWKRHGIFVPPDDLKADDQIALAQKMSWPFMGMPGIPFNLMMANEKAVVAQRMLAAAAAANSATEQTAQTTKRIKLEITDEDVQRANDENQENKSISNLGAEPQQAANLPSTTSDAQKILADSLNSGANISNSPEAAVGLQNLQKLQSMIQQLNDLNGKRPVACHICGRELENQYALHGHMMTDHSGIGIGGAGVGGIDGSMMPLNFQQHIFQQQQQKQLQMLSPSGSPGSMGQMGSELRCNQCDRDFGTLQEFKQHIAEVHLLSGSPLREGFVTPERPINPNSAGAGSSGGVGSVVTRPPYTITPTSSYCEICNKELCNKYFMKTHMQRMHGIEIENGAQIGGVVCNICNKELCSKYFLRVHKHNTHGIIEEGAPLPQPRQNGLNFEAQQQQQQQQQQQVTENDVGRSLNVSPFASGRTELSERDAKNENSSDARYYANYTEVCAICTRRFRSPKWLRAHLLSDHGSAGIEKLREMEQQFGTFSKPSSPTLNIPNGSGSGGGGNCGSGGGSSTDRSAEPSISSTNLISKPANLAQALQSLNAQHLLGSMPKNILPGMFGAVAEQALQSPRFKDYQCSMCPFTTPYYAFLFIHERSHTILNTESNSGAAEAATPSELAAKSGLNSDSETVMANNDDDNGDNIKVRNIASLTQEIPQLSQFPLTTETIDEEGGNEKTITVEPTNLSRRLSPGAIAVRATTPNSPSTSPQLILSANASNDERTTNKAGGISTSPLPMPMARPEVNRENIRSIATSPISSVLSEIANKLSKPACYAIPKNDNSGDGEFHQMQAFLLEAQRSESSDGVAVNENGDDNGAVGNLSNNNNNNNSNRFVPAIIYLPVRECISGTITVSFKLTPA